MTEHHRSAGYLKFSARMRPLLQAQIDGGGLPCVNRCRMGGVVMPGQVWDVAHVVDAAEGGTDTVDNVGAAHRYCNRSDGGRKGQAKQQATRKEEKRFPNW